MRTSYSQFSVIVEFMERFGDLSRPSSGPHGRRLNIKRWKELTNLLNSDDTGEMRTELKWRKVWSDLKNNTKKKAAKISRSMRGTGGGPPLNLHLTDIEERVMAVIGHRSATGINTVCNDISETVAPAEMSTKSPEYLEVGDEDWHSPGTSSDPTTSMFQEFIDRTSTQDRRQAERTENNELHWTPRPKKQIRNTSNAESMAKSFLECQKNRDREFLAMERERIRQRDTELQLQAQWQEIFREALNLLKNYMNTE